MGQQQQPGLKRGIRLDIDGISGMLYAQLAVTSAPARWLHYIWGLGAGGGFIFLPHNGFALTKVQNSMGKVIYLEMTGFIQTCTLSIVALCERIY